MEEVKISEEWEAVKKNILEIGIEKGIQQKLQELVSLNWKKGYTVSQMADFLGESEETIQRILDEIVVS